jgi:hypothetical protein
VRRITSLFAALVLVGSLAGSSLAAGSPPKNSFTGDFDLMAEDGTLLGHATARLFEPTDQRLVPGAYDFMGAPSNWIRESHAQIGGKAFYNDPDHWPNGAAFPGANVAYGWGVECVYGEPGNTFCHDFAVMFIDNLDPSVPNQVAFANSKLETGEFDFQYWQVAGKGSFVLKYLGTQS